METFAGRRVLVAGAGVAGAASARALLREGAEVIVVDQAASARTEALAAAGAGVVIAGAPADGSGPVIIPEGLLRGVAEVVVSPGFPPYHPVASAALAAGLEVYSEPELAWRLRGPDAPAWLAITGTNGKTTTTTMLAAILRAAGLRTAALGNIGEPLVDAARDGASYDVLAVELSSFQLHWSRTLAPQAGALLNLADDHLDWHGGFEAYARAKTAIWRAAGAGAGLAVGNLDDPRVAELLAAVGAPSRGLPATPVDGYRGALLSIGAPEGCPLEAGAGRVVGVTLGPPAPGRFGVTDGMLIDHSGAEPVELASVAAVRPVGAHNVGNALHAAALARGYGVPPEAVAAGLAGYQPEPHRNAYVATVGGVEYVDDSKATNPHAALASLTAYPRIVWVAGGQLKGVDVDELVAAVAGRLVGAVLLGVDRQRLADALARHAPGLPVVDIPRADDEVMGEVVGAAARLAAPGDTVLLAPAAASLDMFTSYAYRGNAFAAAVRALRAGAADGDTGIGTGGAPGPSADHGTGPGR